ncbi:CdaR family transcriptional regulator [Glutamicibacter sp.]|uniref:CdaR family transcriptional regulator n=1 Tax=Glutamicibacter sp. TaxID=1931995 RepID=UPI002FE2152B
MSEMEQPRLASALAQKVVDTISPTINRHVNIMNEHGIIIASSDSSRIGTLHAGSLEVLRDQRVIRVTHGDETAGTQPGVNLPLKINDRVCGVIGLTGAPHEVEPLADLIALTVQLLVAQEREHSRSARRAAEARDILSALLAGNVAPEIIGRMLQAHGLSGHLHLEVCLVGKGQAAGQEPVFEQPGTQGVSTSWVTLFGARWRLRKASEDHGQNVVEPNDRYLGGPGMADVGELLARAEVLRTLVARPELIPLQGHHDLWTEDIAVAIARTPVSNLKYLAIPAQELNQEQAKTLLVVASVASMSQAAEVLHIHRNTLMQRLERIGQVTGVDTRLTSESLRLQHAIYARVALGQLQIF